jgi:ribonuclease HI
LISAQSFFFYDEVKPAMSTPNSKHVIITVDGACLGNGQETSRAAAAAILQYQNRKRAIAYYIGPATNQRAEILAAAFALENLKEPCTVTLRSDSKYVVETMSGNFKRKTNLDCWQRLDDAASMHTVSYEWVRGHAGDPLQEAADKLARNTAKLGDATDVMLTETVHRLDLHVTPALRNAITEGLRYLAGHCDGARHRDGVGFNKYDADFGHRLATTPNLSPVQVAAGHRLLSRYRNQIAAYNPGLAAIL